MAKISLRAYFREIEGLIEHGQLDEATAHCKHILKSYPKLITAYRLLGKTYLEDQRYGDAADIFQRVLSSIPDDFVSQVGMSIIREDEGNLDSAIWHMERAFEVQPYNGAIQDEVRRLFQRRDGIEPHKVRLTRGALARMYAKGDLYQQAIGELRAAQTEDAQRPDLQILLARMYYLSGNLVEAVDVCSVLIKKLPYCLEANRLLAAILPQTERKDEAKIYHQRVVALDPYIAAAPITTTSADGVPENTAVMDKLDYKAAPPGSEATSQPAWAASLGVSLEGFLPSEESLPDWMTADDLETTPPASSEKGIDQGAETIQTSPGSAKIPWEQPAEAEPGLPDWISSSRKGIEDATGSKKPAVTGSLIPNWMKEAGWESSSSEGSKLPPETTPLETGEQPDEHIVRADLPEWLRAMAPPDLGQEQPEAETSLPWEAGEASPGSGTGLPDWLAGIGKQEEEQPASSEPTPPPKFEEPKEGEEGPAATYPAEETQEPAAEPGLDVGAQAAALAWLESLAAKHGAAEDELITQPEERSDEVPSWLSDLSQEEGAVPELPEQDTAQTPAVPPVLPQAEPAGEWLPEETLPGETAKTEVESAEPAVELPDWLQEVMSEAPPEALGEEGLPGAEESEMPEWLQALSKQESQEETSEEFAQADEPALTEGKLPDWLESLAEPSGEEEVVEAVEEEATILSQGQIPDWLPSLDEAEEDSVSEEPIEEAPVVEEIEPAAITQAPEMAKSEDETVEETQEPTAEPGFDLSDQTAALAWLESLALKHGATEEELITRPEDRSGETPGWLRDAAPAEPAQAEAEPAEPQAETEVFADTQPVRVSPVEPSGVAEISTPTEQAVEAEEETLQAEEVLEEIETPVLVEEEAEAEAVQGIEEILGEETGAEETADQAIEIPPALVEEPALESPQEPVEVLEEAPVEMAEEAAPVAEESPAPGEAVPELPTWIAELEAEEPEEEDYAWMPPKMAAEAALAETEASLPEEPVQELPEAAVPTTSPPSPETQETPAPPPTRLVNINTASLIELESLPGVGFIQAQNIITYRDAHGPFAQVTDLLEVPGFNPATLEDIQERLTTGAPEKPSAPASFEELEPEAVDPDQAILIQARNALIQENVAETVARYSYLIKRERMLDTVIRDLYEALYHFPMDISIWQTLGDAYVRNNQLQEALDAYVKAEELLR